MNAEPIPEPTADLETENRKLRDHIAYHYPTVDLGVMKLRASLQQCRTHIAEIEAELLQIEHDWRTLSDRISFEETRAALLQDTKPFRSILELSTST
jgi:hypothetical protein